MKKAPLLFAALALAACGTPQFEKDQAFLKEQYLAGKLTAAQYTTLSQQVEQKREYDHERHMAMISGALQGAAQGSQASANAAQDNLNNIERYNELQLILNNQRMQPAPYQPPAPSSYIVRPLGGGNVSNRCKLTLFG